MRRAILRIILRLVCLVKRDGFFYRLQESISRWQAPCPVCHKTMTAIGNRECSDCVLKRGRRDYRISELAKLMANEMVEEWGKEELKDWLRSEWDKIFSEETDEELELACRWERIALDKEIKADCEDIAEEFAIADYDGLKET